jgi:hypothetical protein
LPERPINAAIARDLCLLEQLAPALVVPFIEDGVERGRPSAPAISAAGSFVTGAQWLVGNLASALAIICRDAEVKRDGAVTEPPHLYEARAQEFQHHKSSADRSARYPAKSPGHGDGEIVMGGKHGKIRKNPDQRRKYLRSRR